MVCRLMISIYVIKKNLKNEVLEVLEQAETLILASLFVIKMKHCQFLLVLEKKSFQIRSFFCSVFFRIRA